MLTLEQALVGITASVTRVTRRIDIYEADGETLWMGDVEFSSGSISVTHSGEAVRRTLDITFVNHGDLDNYPDNFWYDKIIKPYRGIETADGEWETQLGEYMIDDISEPHFPHTISVKGSDYGKKLMLSKHDHDTTYPDDLIEETVRTIATNAGISPNKMILPDTGISIGLNAGPYERKSERWTAIKQVAHAHNYEVYFDTNGWLVMEPMQDPVLSPRVLTLQTGPEGNLASYTKSANDSLIRNHILVVGNHENNNQSLPPVWAVAKNTNPESPTRISQIGDRFDDEDNPLITTFEQAQARADVLLSLAALESFDLSFESIVIPWLDVGHIIEFIDPNPNPGDPTAFLLSELTIPLALGAMSGTGRRITVVG